MAKKCIPGVICVENMTLFLIVFLCIIIFYLFHQLFRKNMTTNGSDSHHYPTPPLSIITPTNTYLAGISTSRPNDPLTDPYVPPTINDMGYYTRRAMMPFYGGGISSNAPIQVPVPVPVSIPTQPFDPQYRQVGILNRKTGSNDMILPLMGRRQLTSRDKWQYYTFSGGASGNLQTKLPISVKGKSCTGEYGCDEIYNGDTVYVEGFKEMFVATIYENGTFSYNPF